MRESVWRVIGDTPKKRWLNVAVIPPKFKFAIPDSNEATLTSNATIINQTLDNASTMLSKLKSQALSNMEGGDGALGDELINGQTETEANEDHSGSPHTTNKPFNWRDLQNTPSQIICCRAYVALQAIVICSLILLVIVSYVSCLRTPFGPTMDLNATNGQIPTDSFLVFRMYFAFDEESMRLTRPFASIVALTWICVLLFTLDLIARTIFCPNLWKWLRSIYTITDILSLIPFYVEGLMYAFIAKFENTSDKASQTVDILKVLDVINLLKICVAGRLFRILQRQRATRVLLYTIRTSAFNMFMILELMALCAVFFGTAIFFLDAKFDTIFHGMWWALVTMATVGYGDIVPGSITGYAVAVICIFAGILLTSYTVPILVNDFLLYYSHADQLAWMRRVHNTATAKRKTDRRDLLAKRRMSRVRTLLKSTGIGSSSVTRNSQLNNTTS